MSSVFDENWEHLPKTLYAARWNGYYQIDMTKPVIHLNEAGESRRVFVARHNIQGTLAFFSLVDLMSRGNLFDRETAAAERAAALMADHAASVAALGVENGEGA